MSDKSTNKSELRPYGEYPILREQATVQDLLDAILGDGIVAGSFAAYVCSQDDNPWQPNDVDIFALSNDHALNISRRLCQLQNYTAVRENPVAISLERDPWDYPVQVIRPSPAWGDCLSGIINFVETVIDDFDLNVCRAAIIGNSRCFADFEAGTRVGRVLRINNPLKTLKRVIKYAARGVVFDDHELCKLFQAWQRWPMDKRTSELAGALERRTEANLDRIIEGDHSAAYYYPDPDDWFDGE